MNQLNHLINSFFTYSRYEYCINFVMFKVEKMKILPNKNKNPKYELSKVEKSIWNYALIIF